MCTKLLAGGCLWLLSVGTLANDGFWVGTGGAGAFWPNRQIQLVEEDLSIKLSNDYAEVEVQFMFKNHGPATTVTMGFPEETYNWSNPMSNVRSWIDGEPVRMQRYVIEADDSDKNYISVWLKDVDFASGNTRRVRVSYRTDLGGSNDGSKDFIYILRTAATWKGVVERLTISVDWTGVKTLTKPDFSTTDHRDLQWRVTGNQSRQVTLRNIIPDFDLWISMLAGFWNFTLNGQRMSHRANYRDYYPVIREGAEVLMRADPDRFGEFLGRPDYQTRRGWVLWAHPAVDALGGKFRFEGNNTLVTGDGRRLKLRRPLQMREPFWEGLRGYVDPAPHVYLRDVIEVLGGTYQYNAEDDRVEIRLPVPPATISATLNRGPILIPEGVNPSGLPRRLRFPESPS